MRPDVTYVVLDAGSVAQRCIAWARQRVYRNFSRSRVFDSEAGGPPALSGAGPFNLRVVGFILVNQQTDQQEFVARRVELLN